MESDCVLQVNIDIDVDTYHSDQGHVKLLGYMECTPSHSFELVTILNNNGKRSFTVLDNLKYVREETVCNFEMN